MKELQAIVRELVGSAEPGVLATLVAVQGSSYRRPGARLLIRTDGSRVGSISGGCLEEDVLARARRVAATHQPETAVYDTTSENDLVWGVGLGCHGIVRVLIERLSSRPAWAIRLSESFAQRLPTRLAVVHAGKDPAALGTRLAADGATTTETTFVEEVGAPTRLCIFGAGDDAQPLARLGKELGWGIVVADPRPAFATQARFPQADEVLVGPVEQLVRRAAPGPDTVAVVMTHHYVHDVPLLRDLLPLPMPYLGLLGPKKRAEKILGDLAATGVAVTGEQRARLHAPVGLDLGADAPEQVALAIAAEIQAVLRGRAATPLRERERPIHQ